MPREDEFAGADEVPSVRIAEMISGTGVDGPSRCCAMLCRQLAARGHEVLLFHRRGAWIAGNVDRAGVRLFEFGRGFAELRRVKRLLRDERVEVLHTHMTGASNFGVWLRLLAGVPVVATLHSGRMRPHWRFNNRVIALSRPTFDRARGACSAARVALIPNFIEAAGTSRPNPAERMAMRRAFGIPDAAFIVGSVGKVAPAKRPMDLVNAVAEVVRAGVDCHLVLVGPIYRDEGKVVAHRAAAEGLAGRLTFAGLRQDVAKILNTLDVYVSPSQEEEMSVAVMEAMAAGLPIVATNVGGLPILVAEGCNGFLTDVGTVGQIADRLVRLARAPELRQRMGAASLERVAADFSPEVIVPRIEQTLAEAAAAGRRWHRAVAARRVAGSA
ncbi:MAG: glycosyltransferase family 4 protein [Bauldia sp.]